MSKYNIRLTLSRLKTKSWFTALCITIMLVSLMILGFTYKPIFAVIGLILITAIVIVIHIDRKPHPEKHKEKDEDNDLDDWFLLYLPFLKREQEKNDD